MEKDQTYYNMIQHYTMKCWTFTGSYTLGKWQRIFMPSTAKPTKDLTENRPLSRSIPLMTRTQKRNWSHCYVFFASSENPVEGNNIVYVLNWQSRKPIIVFVWVCTSTFELIIESWNKKIRRHTSSCCSCTVWRTAVSLSSLRCCMA